MTEYSITEFFNHLDKLSVTDEEGYLWRVFCTQSPLGENSIIKVIEFSTADGLRSVLARLCSKNDPFVVYEYSNNSLSGKLMYLSGVIRNLLLRGKITFANDIESKLTKEL